MKCPWCNAELKDGSVYCDTCGNEINMVPEFDPEIEDQCRETIESMTKDIFNSKNKQKKTSKTGKNSVGNDSSGKKNSVDVYNDSVGAKQDRISASDDRSEKKQNNDGSIKDENSRKGKILRFILFISIFLALIIAAIVIAVRVSSDSYKLSQAEKAYNNAEYDKAVSLYTVLVEKDMYNIDLLEAYSYSLYAIGDMTTYEEVLYRIADSSDSTELQREQAYERLIYIYSGEKEYKKIQDLIISSNMDMLLEKYSDYLNVLPEVVLQEGTYDLPQMLTINSSDIIYYTLTNEYEGEIQLLAEDEVYRLPILLEIGTYKLSVYTMNKYDLKSYVVEAEYNIEIAPPIAPEVSISGGTYSTPQILEVYYDSETVSVYYTTDGSVPNEASQIYREGIVIPTGYTKYSFACADSHGLFSETVTLEIDMQYEYEVQPGTAMDMLITYLLEKGTIVSYDGTMPEGGCLQLVLTGFEPIGQNYCYIYEEAIIVDDVMTHLDVKYSVDMLTGEINKIE